MFNVIAEQSEILLNVKIYFIDMRNISFYLAHLLPFLNQCWIGQNGNIIDQEEQQNEELFAGVTSYFK